MAETMSDEAGGLGPARQPPKAAQMACVVSIALINSLGSVGGAAGPVVIGKLKMHSGNYARGMICVAATWSSRQW
jgi:hypothetical protein